MVFKPTQGYCCLAISSESRHTYMGKSEIHSDFPGMFLLTYLDLGEFFIPLDQTTMVVRAFSIR